MAVAPWLYPVATGDGGSLYMIAFCAVNHNHYIHKHRDAFGTFHTFPFIFTYGEYQAASSMFRSMRWHSMMGADNYQNLWKRGGKRQECTHTHTSLWMRAALFGMEEPLSMFMLIQWDSCGHLQPAYAYVPPRLSKPAPFIILQQPCSNWAASPPAVTHHLLHIEPEEIQMYLVQLNPVAASAFELRMWAAEPQQLHRADPRRCSVLFSLLVPACPSLHSGSPVMMWPISLTGDEATALWASS